jgi:hypothetical protein
MRCAEELAAVPIEEVAKIATRLVCHPARAAAKEDLARKGGDDWNTEQGKAPTQERVDQDRRAIFGGHRIEPEVAVARRRDRTV